MTAAPASDTAHSGPGYGIDAPYVPAIFGGLGLVGLVLGIGFASIGFIVVGILFLFQAALYLHTTLRGKFVVWRRLLDDLSLAGNEDILDLGCGRGAVLVEASTRVPEGSAHGLDLWRSVDQSGNAEAVTRANADAAGTGGRVELHTGDMTQLPFDDASFDLVVSSLAIHNISAADGRNSVLDQAVRVLRPGGRLVLVDIRHVKAYAEHLRGLGVGDVQTSGLGPSFWFGGPWQAASVVTATKDGSV